MRGFTKEQKIEISRGIMFNLDEIGKTAETIEKIWSYREYDNKQGKIKSLCKDINEYRNKVRKDIGHVFGIWSHVLGALAEIELITKNISNKGYHGKHLIDLIFVEISKIKDFISEELFGNNVHWDYKTKKAA
ncbi:hypothetical protein HN652_01080 [archaeon]|jgi:hypothetical protein|nr:hypothetical protein [archaeon]MBT6868915.1 hypothetical protein [archaeon]MBT7192864.1 hypothetical protein [archaeon]MBT7380830.1 hypothetical protein [archaeon]MBT7507585.1 hypothetical protein [archaeon]